MEFLPRVVCWLGLAGRLDAEIGWVHGRGINVKQLSLADQNGGGRKAAGPEPAGTARADEGTRPPAPAVGITAAGAPRSAPRRRQSSPPINMMRLPGEGAPALCRRWAPLEFVERKGIDYPSQLSNVNRIRQFFTASSSAFQDARRSYLCKYDKANNRVQRLIRRQPMVDRHAGPSAVWNSC